MAPNRIVCLRIRPPLFLLYFLSHEMHVSRNMLAKRAIKERSPKTALAPSHHTRLKFQFLHCSNVMQAEEIGARVGGRRGKGLRGKDSVRRPKRTGPSYLPPSPPSPTVRGGYRDKF